METPFFIYSMGKMENVFHGNYSNSMEFHGNCMFHRIQWKTFSMEFHGIPCPIPDRIPWNSMEKVPWNSMGLFYTGMPFLSDVWIAQTDVFFISGFVV